MSDKGWAEAMDGVRYVQHVASPFVTSMPADKMDLIRPAVEGTTRALEAAFAAKVERIVADLVDGGGDVRSPQVAHGAVHGGRLDRSRRPRPQRLHRIQDARRTRRLADRRAARPHRRSRRHQPGRHFRPAARRGPGHLGGADPAPAQGQHAGGAGHGLHSHRRARCRCAACRGNDQPGGRRPPLSRPATAPFP